MMSRTLRFPVLLAGLGAAFAAPSGAGAQTPAQRTVIEAFRDSLDRAMDSTGLARLETGLVQTTRAARTDPFHHLRLGFLALRLGEVGGPRWFEDAAMEFQTVTRLAPAWPYGWYGLGLAEYALGARAATPAAARPGLTPAGAFARAAAALARAAAADPGFIPVIVEEAYFGRRQRQAARARVALDALRLAAIRAPRQAAVLQGLGRLEREFGDLRAALRAFELLLTAPGRNRGLALLEVARTRFLLGEADGSRAYYEGAALDDPATVAAYRADLVPIASEAELARFDASRGAARADYLRRFWGSRDAADFRPEGARVREHYRRMYDALRRFPRYQPLRVRELGTRVAFGDQVDDRGLVFIRHGDPDNRVELSTLGFEPNESWRYIRPDGDLLLHFVAKHGPDDYHLVESLFDVTDPLSQRAQDAGLTETRGEDLLVRSRASLSPFYRMPDGEPGTAGERERAFRVAERAMSRASLVRALTTDSFHPSWARRLGARVDVAVTAGEVGRGEEPGRALAHIALALPFGATGAVWLGQGVGFPYRLRLVGLDPEGATVMSLDSLVRPVAVQHRGDRWLAGVVTVPLPAGRLRVRLAVEDAEGGGTLLPFRSVEVARATDAALGVSDLAVAPVRSPWVATVGGAPLRLDPLGSLFRGQPAEVAFEVWGAGGVVNCQITVVRTDTQPGVAFNETWQSAVQGSAVLRRELPVRRLEPGVYRLELTVSDGPGRLVRRWREFAVAR